MFIFSAIRLPALYACCKSSSQCASRYCRFSSSENPAKNEPDFVTTPFDTDMEFTSLEQDKIMQLKDENKLDELFRMLFIKQCNKLHEILPELFEDFLYT